MILSAFEHLHEVGPENFDDTRWMPSEKVIDYYEIEKDHTSRNIEGELREAASKILTHSQWEQFQAFLDGDENYESVWSDELLR